MPWSSGDSLNSFNLNNLGNNVFNVAAYGANSGGTINAVASFRSALSFAGAAASNNGGVVVVPSGTYALNGNPFSELVGSNRKTTMLLAGSFLSTTSQIKLPRETALIGSGRLVRRIIAAPNFIPYVTVSAATRNNGTVTVTTNAAHGLEPGMTVHLRGVADATFDGGWQVATVPTATSFTYTDSTANGSSSSGTCYIPLIVLGDAEPFNHGTRLEHLTVDCSSLTDSVAIYSNCINEGSHVVGVTITNSYLYGIWLEARSTTSARPLNYWLHDLEILPVSNVSATGIYIRGLQGQHRGLDNITISATTLGIGIDASGAPGLYSRIHVEGCTHGLLLGSRDRASTTKSDSQGIVVAGITGHDGVANVVTIANTNEAHDIVVLGATKLDATNALINDLKNGVTRTDNALSAYFMGSVYARGGNLDLGGVVIDTTGTKITLDGTDSTVTAGSIGIAENSGALVHSSRGGVAVLLDNDNNSMTQQFAIYSDRTSVSGTPLFRVSENSFTEATSTFSAQLVYVSGATIRLNAAGAGGGLAGTASGTAGDIAWGSSSNVTYLYVCVSANSWMRVALNPF